jgi:transcriptional regulator with XRE-family HTH domain
MPEGMSLRSLAQATRRGGGGMSAPHLSRLARGLDPPSVAAMEAIAEALRVDASYFAEYRLAAGRASLDEHGPDGLDGALRRLQRLQADADGPLPRPPGKRSRLAA